jgi:pimeloyl-ACP methyl ester carboxylesterase
MSVSMESMNSRMLMVDGIRTHLWDGGDGEPVVLLHAGGYCENAERSWHRNTAALVGAGYRVIAPDWLGFGRTDKVRDFSRGNAKLVDHLASLLNAMDLGPATFIGLSMGGTFLVQSAASQRGVLPVGRMILVSGGGFSPMNEARKALQEYDGTFEGARRQLQQVFHAPLWKDDSFVRPYHEASLEPGQWEFCSSPRLRAPFRDNGGDFGQADSTDYESIRVPTLMTAGTHDLLREPGYSLAIQKRIAGSEVELFNECGHCPNVEQAERWNEVVIDFLRRRPAIDPALGAPLGIAATV